jgi:hypothetical protein
MMNAKCGMMNEHELSVIWAANVPFLYSSFIIHHSSFVGSLRETIHK